MSAPHRGLPPPAAMPLPDLRGPHSHAMPAGPGTLPPQPSQGARDYDSKDWYFVVKQEEEKTRQEELRLEQRKIEHSILRESMQGGIPLPLIPVIFAGIGGRDLTNAGLEMTQQYMAQYQQTAQQQQAQQQQAQQQQAQQQQQHQQQHQQQQQPQQQPQHQQQHPQPQYAPQQQTTLLSHLSQLSPELRRETRSIQQALPISYQQQPPAPVPQPTPGHAPAPQSVNAIGAYPSPAYQSPNRRSRTNTIVAQYAPLGPQPKQPPQSTLSGLPRLTTNEAQVVHHSSTGSTSYAPAPADRTSPSPSIYFHHWQPPNTQSSKETSKISPTNQNLPAHVSAAENVSSPRKRKSQGPHQPAPPPSSVLRGSSPAYSEKSYTRRSGHGRQSSDISVRGYDPVGRSNRNIRMRSNSGESTRYSSKLPTSTRRRSPEQPPLPTRTESSKSE